jgi:hypothetical protein
VFVVMAGVHAQDSFKIPASEDEDAIEAIPSDGPHPALGERVRVRRLHGRPDHVDPLGPKDPVEGTAELRVVIMDQQRTNRNSRSPSCMTRLRACYATQAPEGVKTPVRRGILVLTPFTVGVDKDAHP